MPLGIAPDAGALHRLIPRRIATGMFLLGRRMTGQEAAHCGLVDRAVPKGQEMAAAREWADQISASASLAMQSVKEVERAIQRPPLVQALQAMRTGDLPNCRPC